MVRVRYTYVSNRSVPGVFGKNCTVVGDTQLGCDADAVGRTRDAVVGIVRGVRGGLGLRRRTRFEKRIASVSGFARIHFTVRGCTDKEVPGTRRFR